MKDKRKKLPFLFTLVRQRHNYINVSMSLSSLNISLSRTYQQPYFCSLLVYFLHILPVLFTLPPSPIWMTVLHSLPSFHCYPFCCHRFFLVCFFLWFSFCINFLFLFCDAGKFMTVKCCLMLIKS